MVQSLIGHSGRGDTCRTSYIANRVSATPKRHLFVGITSPRRLQQRNGNGNGVLRVYCRTEQHERQSLAGRGRERSNAEMPGVGVGSGCSPDYQ